MNTTELLQNEVHLLNGHFMPSEAKDVIKKVIDEQIRSCKLQNLQCWMQNHDTDHELMDQRISQLTQRKQEIMKLIRDARQEGRELKLSFSLSLDN